MIKGIETLKPEVREFFYMYLDKFQEVYIQTMGQKMWDSLTKEQRFEGAMMVMRDLARNI
jgi:hypothetical protein